MNLEGVLKKFQDQHHIFTSAHKYLEQATQLLSGGTEADLALYSDFSQKVVPTYRDPQHFFLAQIFITFIAAFELFLQEAAVQVITKYPNKVGKVDFSLAFILEVNDSSELVRRAIEKVLNNLAYERPASYLESYCQLLSLNPGDYRDYWPQFVEAKARRDLGVHNGWICNEVFLRKLQEVNRPTTLTVGDSAIPERGYMGGVALILWRLAGRFKTKLEAKYPKE